MQLFLIIAAAHFLALLSPGPDFFLVARTSLAEGWRTASGACLGIALANGLFIVAAFAGTAVLTPGSAAFTLLQLAGCLYLLYLGVLFIRHAGHSGLGTVTSAQAGLGFGTWHRAASRGLLSGLLNPKNALFYASLASMLSGPYVTTGWKTLYGIWMFGVVLLWDILIAFMIGNPYVLRRFERALPWLERISGGMLIVLALGVIAFGLA